MMFIIGLLLFVSSLMARQVECVLLYYHHKPLPDDLLYAYDWVVLDADNPFYEVLKDKAFYQKRRAKVIGYMSVGEIEKYRDYYKELKRFAIGKNTMWDSLVADLRQKEYRDFLLNVVAHRIVQRGFDGFMLDTLDSYQLASKPEEWKDFQLALVDFIKELKRRYPDKIIVLNRGFEFLERVKDDVNGVMAESLFYGIDEKKRYVPMPEEGRKWLLDQLSRAKSYGLTVIVVDYIDPKDKRKAKEVMKNIADLGFVPYVADKELSRVGHSKCEITPRRVLLPYSSKQYPVAQYEPKHRLTAMILEYLGFVPEMWDVEKGFPEVYPELGYKGILVGYMDLDRRFIDWLLKAKEEGLKIFFFNSIPYDDKFFRAFGIRADRNRDKSLEGLRVVSPKDHRGFEAPVKVSYADTLFIAQGGKPVVEAVNSLGQKHHPFALFDWGGYAINDVLLNKEELWSFDPFEVFKKVFEPQFPIPDLTTQNGGRILTAHIDGDAFFGDAEFDARRTTGEVIRDEIIKKYTIPHGVSLIVGEIAEEGLYPERSKRLIEVAKSIYSLPWVEPATHTYSHPYDWQVQYRKKALLYGYNLPIRGYTIDWHTEISQSAKWIGERILDKKREVSLIFWSGECNPNKEQLEIAYKSRLFNINGGYTAITMQEPFLKNVGPSGINYGPYFQIYAPVQNENIYTNLWMNPFWGYINVIQTFRLTEEPRRLKPMSIYYHFYSGSKIASLNALKNVYEYALSQEHNPMFISEYARWVLDFRNTVIFREGESFRIKNEGNLRTLRYPKEWGYPDMRKSSGIVGYREGKDGYKYLFLDGSGDYKVFFSRNKPEFALLYSNGYVKKFEKSDKGYVLVLESYTPLAVRLESKCKVYVDGGIYKGEFVDFTGGKHAEIKAVCSD
ncbi:bifunctional glycoside hydrolase 114/ polysaccharide deacetylase family protein [Thermocrinis sp.]